MAVRKAHDIGGGELALKLRLRKLLQLLLLMVKVRWLGQDGVARTKTIVGGHLRITKFLLKERIHFGRLLRLVRETRRAFERGGASSSRCGGPHLRLRRSFTLAVAGVSGIC